MSIDLYTLRKRAVIVLHDDGDRESVRILQLAVRQALSQDAGPMVDAALKHATGEWWDRQDLAGLVVQVGADGTPRPGSPLYRWNFHKRPFCFDHELPQPMGYLGERESCGFLFRTVKEQKRLKDLETATHIDNRAVRVYKDFWKGELFESGEEFLRYRGLRRETESARNGSGEGPASVVSGRVSKILSLIRLIERKGERASAADLHFLCRLKDKAFELGQRP